MSTTATLALAELPVRTYTEERLLDGFHAALGEWRTARIAYGATLTRHVHDTLDRWRAEGIIESDPKIRMWQEPRYRLVAHDPVRLRRALVDAAGRNLANTASNAQGIIEKMAQLDEDYARLGSIITKLAPGEANCKAVSNVASTISMHARSLERLQCAQPALATEVTRINRMCRAAGFDRDAVWAGHLHDPHEGDGASPLEGDD